MVVDFDCIPQQVLDVMLVATEFKLKQFLATEAFGFVYIAFNIAFFLLAEGDDRVIYNILDWGDSLQSAIVFTLVLLFILVPVFSVFYLGVFRRVQIALHVDDVMHDFMRRSSSLRLTLVSTRFDMTWSCYYLLRQPFFV